MKKNPIETCEHDIGSIATCPACRQRAARLLGAGGGTRTSEQMQPAQRRARGQAGARARWKRGSR